MLCNKELLLCRSVGDGLMIKTAPVGLLCLFTPNLVPLTLHKKKKKKKKKK